MPQPHHITSFSIQWPSFQLAGTASVLTIVQLLLFLIGILEIPLIFAVSPTPPHAEQKWESLLTPPPRFLLVFLSGTDPVISSGSAGTSFDTVVIASVSVSAGLLLALLLGVYYYQRRQAARLRVKSHTKSLSLFGFSMYTDRDDDSGMSTPLMYHAHSSSVSVIKESDYAIRFEDLQLGPLINSGAGGSVYRYCGKLCVRGVLCVYTFP
jgi:hypothetical protein